MRRRKATPELSVPWLFVCKSLLSSISCNWGEIKKVGFTGLILPVRQWISNQPQMVSGKISCGGTSSDQLVCQQLWCKMSDVCFGGCIPAVLVPDAFSCCGTQASSLSFATSDSQGDFLKISRDKVKIIPVAFCWLAAVVALSCTTFAQSSWAKSRLKDWDSLCHMTGCTSPCHCGIPNTVWKNSFQNSKFFKVVETTGTNQMIKYGCLRPLSQTSQSPVDLWGLLHNSSCFCLLYAVMPPISPPHFPPPHSIRFLRNTAACMLQTGTSVLV